MLKKKLQGRKNAKISNSKSRALQRKSNKILGVKTIENKIHIILKNLLLFGILFILSIVLYNLSSANIIFTNFFGILALITGVITLAFIISYLIFFFLKTFKH